MNCSAVIARYVSALGVRQVFGYPGDPNVELMEALRREGLDFVLATREGTAGLMAEAAGMLTGRPGVAVSTLGPGSSNLVNAVANAFLDRVPMLAISGQIEAKREPTFTHQVLDHNRLFSSITKWTATVQPDTVGHVLRKAIRIAMAERPGPVHLSTPGNVVGAEAKDADVHLPPMAEAATGAQIFAAPGADADVARRLSAARRPLILAGIGAVRAGAGAALRALAEHRGVPVIAAPMAKGIMAEDHAYFAGTLDMACNAYVWEFVKSADLLLAVGFDAVELIKPWTVSVPTIHIDSTPNTDQIYAADVEAVGAIPAIVEALRAAVPAGAAWSAAEVARHREGLKRLYYDGRVRGKLNPTDVIDAVRAALPPETIATTDVGSHKLLVGQGWTTLAPRTLLMTNGLSSMGFALPAAIAAQMLRPRTPVVCLVGDGGLAMVQGELRLAASRKLPLVVVVFQDGSLNRIELKQTARQYASFGTTFEHTDMEKLAAAMGCDGVTVESMAALERALAARPSARPLVIGARIDPTQYAAQF